MKRDLELIRLLMLDLEGEQPVDLSIYNKDQLNYHKALLIDAGYIEGKAHYSSSHFSDIPDAVLIKRVTNEGHEFISKAMNEKTWNKAKSIIKEKGGSLSMEALKIALSEAVKNILN